jgi:hypothetical protein
MSDTLRAAGILPITKTETLVISLPALPVGGSVGNKFQFPDDQYIRDKKLVSLKVYPQELLPLSVNNVPNAPMSYISQAFLTLESYSGVQFVKDKPLQDFQNGALAVSWNTYPQIFRGQRVNWPKSYIFFPNPALVFLPTNVDMVIEVGFTEVDKDQLKTELDAAFKKMK